MKVSITKTTPLAMDAKNIHPELIEAINKNKLIVFAGSGTSKKSGFPEWVRLVEHFLKKIESSDPIYNHYMPLLNAGVVSPLQVLNQIEHFKAIILTELASILVIDRNCNLDLHRKILELTRRVITTNYDKCFESAWGGPTTVIHNDDSFNLWRLRSYEEFLFKIHGDIDHINDCILFQKQYEGLYNREAFWFSLMNLLLDNTVLFIGFSLSDPYFNTILEKIKKLYDGFTNKHFVITTDHRFKESPNFQELIIPLVIEDYDFLPELLDDLLKYKPVFTNLPARNHKGENCRKAELSQLKEKIRNGISIIVVEGPEGIGKTSFALDTGTALLKKPNSDPAEVTQFNYVVWMTGNEINHNTNGLNYIFDSIARTFNAERITRISPDQIDTKAKTVSNLLNHNRTLLIIDDFEIIREPENILKWLDTISGFTKVILAHTNATSIGIQHTKVVLECLNEDRSEAYIKAELGADIPEKYLTHWSETTKSIVELTRGFPGALKLVAGQIRQGTFNANQTRKLPIEKPEEIINYFHEQAWEKLNGNAKMLLYLCCVFIGNYPINQSKLLKASNDFSLNFEQGVKDCLLLNMLNFDKTKEQYYISSQTLAFIKTRIDEQTQDQIREFWITSYMHFVRSSVVRNMPNEPYWNALVSDKMNALKAEWPVIIEIIGWAADHHDEIFVELICLLVHYMDSRFYNQERLNYVQAATDAAKRLDKTRLAALLHIDALGWTYTEESKFDLAEANIKQGLEIAETLNESTDNEDLISLGYAWLAKIKIEQADELNIDMDTAKEELISKSFKYIYKALEYNDKAWINYRIFMAAGDLFVHESDYSKALNMYEKAISNFNSYGGEGGNYQINPRLGMAYLGNQKLDKAEEVFKSVISDDILIGNLYGRLGLAFVAFKRGKVVEAKQRITEIEYELRKRTSSNVLLKLIKQFKQQEGL